MAEIIIGRVLMAATDSVTAEQGTNSLPWVTTSPLVPASYDRIALAYTGDDVTSVTYYEGDVPVAVLTLAYTAGKLTSVSRA